MIVTSYIIIAIIITFVATVIFRVIQQRSEGSWSMSWDDDPQPILLGVGIGVLWPFSVVVGLAALIGFVFAVLANKVADWIHDNLKISVSVDNKATKKKDEEER